MSSSAPPPPYQEIAADQKGYGTAPPPPGTYQGGYQPLPQGGYPQQPPAGAYQGGYVNQAGPQQPPAGAYPQQPPAGAYPQQPSYQQYGVVVQQPAPQVVLVGGCPACRVGALEEDYTCLGVLCAILFFPLGILCCLAMKQRRCPNCGAVFD